MKILFTDLDQTLFDDKKNVTQKTRQALAAMEKAGNIWVPVSGRAPISVINTFKSLSLYKSNMIVAGYNGGHIVDCSNNKTLFRNPLEIEDVKFMFDKAHEEGLHCHTYCKDSVICEHESPELDFYISHVKMDKKVVPNCVDALTEGPIKLIVMSMEGRKLLDPFREKMLPFTKDRFYSTYSAEFLLEYSHPDTNKGMAVKFLSQYFGIDIKDTVAVGDEENDLPMIEAAGIGVAMINGRDECKEKAAYITAADNNHDAIAEIIYKFELDK